MWKEKKKELLEKKNYCLNCYKLQKNRNFFIVNYRFLLSFKDKWYSLMKVFIFYRKKAIFFLDFCRKNKKLLLAAHDGPTDNSKF